MNLSIETFLADGRTAVYDGAKGTLLADRLEPGTPPDLLNISAPDVVFTAYQAYVEAGAEIIQTNTFNATRIRLSLHDSSITDEQIREINRQGALLARMAAGDKAFVAGDIGPLGQLLEPNGSVSHEEARAAFRTQVEGLVIGGVDLIHIETMYDVEEVKTAIDAVREVSPQIPIIVTMTFTSYREEYGYKTMFGVSPQQLVVVAHDYGLLAHGANCGNGFDHMERLMEQLQGNNLNASIVAKLNAGIPERVDGHDVYPQATRDGMVLYTHAMMNAGAKIVGACCGSTPALIHDISTVVHGHESRRLKLPVSDQDIQIDRFLREFDVMQKEALATKNTSASYNIALAAAKTKFVLRHDPKYKFALDQPFKPIARRGFEGTRHPAETFTANWILDEVVKRIYGGEYEKAEQLLSVASELQPDLPRHDEVHTLLNKEKAQTLIQQAQLQWKEDRHIQAYESCKEAARLNPTAKQVETRRKKIHERWRKYWANLPFKQIRETRNFSAIQEELFYYLQEFPEDKVAWILQEYMFDIHALEPGSKN